jgi:hypothetical protein
MCRRFALAEYAGAGRAAKFRSKTTIGRQPAIREPIPRIYLLGRLDFD